MQVGSGSGVAAESASGNGVYGQYADTTGLAGPAGVHGDSLEGTGVFGTTKNQIGVRGLHGGYSGQEALGGFGAAGFVGGVVGESTATGVGVIGASPNGVGVDALSTAGTAVKATSTTGKALDVHGKAAFTRSGVLTIAAGGSYATTVVPVPGGLVATSHVLATMQTNAAGIAVRAAVPSPATGKITIFLTANAPAGGVVVAWFVFG